MKIYTKTGDDGRTGLLGPGRVPKDSPRIDAYGTVDELNAVVGLARSLGLDPVSDGIADVLQSLLFSVGAALADPDPDGPFHRTIGSAHIERLERYIDELETELPPLTRFILPGGMSSASALHLARTVCRRAERQVVTLAAQPHESVPSELIVFLNRLSDLLFVMARAVNRRGGLDDVPWNPL